MAKKQDGRIDEKQIDEGLKKQGGAPTGRRKDSGAGSHESGARAGAATRNGSVRDSV